MPTHALIARKEDGSDHYEVIYLHCDGYPEHAGTVLKDHFCDPNRLDELFALGHLSSLYPTLHPPKGQPHSYWNPVPEVTIAHHRDLQRHWAGCRPELFEDFYPDDWQRKMGQASYIYMKADPGWVCYNTQTGKTMSL